MLENDVRFADEQDGKLCKRFLFPTESDYWAGEGRTKEEPEAPWNRIKCKRRLILRGHALASQGLKEPASVTSAFSPLTLRKHQK